MNMKKIESVKYIVDESGNNQSFKADFNGTIVIVPFQPGNSHYDSIQEWLAEGNTPTPADEP